MTIINKLFLEKEIKAILGVFVELEYEFRDFENFEFIRKLAEKFILKNKNDITKMIKKQQISPRRVACSWINNVTGDLLETGKYHIWRGALDLIGESFLKIFDKSTEMLVELGDFTEEYGKEHKINMRDRIQEIG